MDTLESIYLGFFSKNTCFTAKGAYAFIRMLLPVKEKYSSHSGVTFQVACLALGSCPAREPQANTHVCTFVTSANASRYR